MGPSAGRDAPDFWFVAVCGNLLVRLDSMVGLTPPFAELAFQGRMFLAGITACVEQIFLTASKEQSPVRQHEHGHSISSARVNAF